MSENTNQIERIFELMPDRFDAEEAGDLEAVYQFDLAGDEGGVWHVIVNHGACKVFPGAADNPDTIIAMPAKDYVHLVSGKTNASLAFMSGKLKIEGDMELAMRMQKIFPTGK